MRRRVLAGLTPEETREFELLDAQIPFDGKPVWPSAGLSLSPVECRWLELFEKMENASQLISALDPLRTRTTLGTADVRSARRSDGSRSAH
jgi:hypothetical protein